MGCFWSCFRPTNDSPEPSLSETQPLLRNHNPEVVESESTSERQQSEKQLEEKEFKSEETVHQENEVTLRLLNEELHEVFEWFSLGLHLDIPPPELYGIRHDPTLRSTEEFRTEMLSRWMRKLPKPSWYRVVKALMEIGREALAHKISLKYGVPVPSSVEEKQPQVDTSTQPSVPWQKELSAKLRNLKNDVKERDKELLVKDQSLEEARRQKDEERVRMKEIKQNIKQTYTRAVKLLSEKREIQEDIEQFQNKEREIRELQQGLHDEVQELRRKLHQATTEFEKKSAVEREQEKVNASLKTHLDRTRKMLDFLQSAGTSKDQYIVQFETQLKSLRDEFDSKKEEISQHKLKISQREQEIKIFAQQLQDQEARITQLQQYSAEQEPELVKCIYILDETERAAELRDKLEEAEKGRWRVARNCETALLENEILKRQIEETKFLRATMKLAQVEENIKTLLHQKGEEIKCMHQDTEKLLEREHEIRELQLSQVKTEKKLIVERMHVEDLKKKHMEVERQLELREKELERLRTVHQQYSEQLQNK